MAAKNSQAQPPINQQGQNFIQQGVQPMIDRSGDAMRDVGNMPLIKLLAEMLAQPSAPAQQRRGSTTSQQVGPYKGPMATDIEKKR